MLVTGLQGAGKSTVGALLAARFERAAFIEGDVLWKMIVAGREDMTAEPSEEARRQLELRYRNGALLGDSYARAGITAIHVDIVVGADLTRYAEWVTTRPLRIVMLNPRPEVVVKREHDRGSDAYRSWINIEGSLAKAVEHFSRWLDDTPHVGLWLDSSDLSPEQTVDRVLENWDDALVLP